MILVSTKNKNTLQLGCNDSRTENKVTEYKITVAFTGNEKLFLLNKEIIHIHLSFQ